MIRTNNKYFPKNSQKSVHMHSYILSTYAAIVPNTLDPFICI